MTRKGKQSDACTTEQSHRNWGVEKTNIHGTIMSESLHYFLDFPRFQLAYIAFLIVKKYEVLLKIGFLYK